MKSALIVAALCAAVISAPFGAQAAAAKLTDHDLYCSFRPLTSKCAPAAPVAVKPAAAVAMVAPAAKPAPKFSIKMLACEKRADGKAYLMSCAWK